VINSFNNVLILAPHTDDGELGLGGTISRLVEQGCTVHYVAFSTAQESVPAGFPKDALKYEVKNATKKLGIAEENLTILDYPVRKFSYHRQEILEDLIKIRKEVLPDAIFIPSTDDVHQDHEVISNEGVRAFKGYNLFGYELIWNNFRFKSTCFIELQEKHIEKKIESLSCYKTQQNRDYISEDYLRSHARTRGVQIGVKYAECFEVIRCIIK